MENDSAKYCEDFILRKEGRKKWIEYWVVIRGVWMLFYSSKATTNRDNFKGSIELTSECKCNIAKRRTYSFPFYVSTKRGTHLFKCESNLKRHQWIYLIGLAIKGVPPTPAPYVLPSTAVFSSDDDFIHTAPKDHTDIERQDSDEDDWSLPPGVILVTTPIDELSRKEDFSTRNSNIIRDTTQIHPQGRAVLSTGITGATRIVQEPRKTNHVPRLLVSKSNPKFSHSFEHSRGLSTQRKSPISSNSDVLSLNSFYLWDRGTPERPSSSPSRSPSPRDSSPKLLATAASRENMKFSRHMAMSAPDIKLLSLEDLT